MPPQEGVGGWMPRPRKERPASSRMTSPTPRVAATSSGAEHVGQQVPEDNAPARRPERFGGAHEFLLAEAQHLAAHQPAGAEPPGGSRYQDERRERNPLPHREQEEQEEEPGNREGAVHQLA